MAIKVIKNRCPQNHPCPAINVCPVNALKQNGFEAPAIDESKCIDCGKCTRYCPMGALVKS
jgi:Fe-S-cluster-containing hydrogenase component 2